MAFAVVQHLDPTHESLLTELLRKFTRMPVAQVVHNTLVEPNCVYVIPPNADLELRGGVLHLVKPTMLRGLHLPIDHFFRSLATDQGEKAICIILSGTGSDGTLGMKAIKEEGGLAIVESPASARYDGMPSSAINTGLVDMVLPPEKIAQQLMDYVKRSFEPEARQSRQFAPGNSDHLQSIFLLLKNHTGHDFSGYKENTIARRIERRMTVNQIANVEDYLRYLQTSPLEIATLFRELLIGVTSFFRDRNAFEYLEEKVIPSLFAASRENPGQIRVWIPGCSTGEEAYSVAILLHERMERSPRKIDIQIFATDIDQSAIFKAREGRYLDSIAADVTPERLNRFFTREKEGNTYQVKRQIRDMVVFAVQSVFKDPPFSKLDLICCRNLMIYLGPELQQKLLSLFHYALNRGGFLFLGNSETLGNSQKLFRTIDQKWKIFQRAEFVSDIRTVLEFSSQARRDVKSLVTFPERQMSAREVTEQMLLSDYVPTSILVNERAEMLYIHGHTGKYLEQSTGEASTNILQMAREGLRRPLSIAIRNASAQKKRQTVEAVSVKSGKATIRVHLSIAPVLKPANMQGLMLVTLTEIPTPAPTDTKEPAASDDELQIRHIAELEQELASTREYLQTVVEELETTNEELKSSNEELLSANEELQSTNEELQTSKEELQSINEELVTVNTELQSKVDELTFANNDVKNLMENVQVGIIFLDTKLRIRRFTQASKQIVDLIPEDVGRPLKQFVHKLHYDRLIQDAQETLKTQKVKEVDVQAEGGTWHLLRIMPYRTMDEQMSGVVLTLTDVTQIKQAEEALRRSEEKFRAISSNTPDHIMMQDHEFRYEFVVNPQIGLTEQDMLGKTDHDFLSKEDADNLTRLKKQVLESGKPLHLEIPVRSREGVEGYFDGSFIPKFDAAGKVTGLIGYFKDVTARKQAEESLRNSEANYRLLFAKNPNPMWVFDEDTLQFVAVNDAATQCYGWSRNEFLSMSVLDIRPPEDRPLAQIIIAQNRNAQENKIGVVRHWKKDGTVMEMDVNATTITYEGRPGRLCSMNDLTDRKRAEEALQENRALLRSYLDNLPALFFVKDLSGKVLDMNKTIEAAFGVQADQLIGKTDADFHPPEEAAAIFANDQWVAQTGKTLQAEEPTRLPDGEHLFLSTKFPIRNHKGVIVGTAGISFDITERKRAEEELRFHAELLNAVGQAIIATDTEGQVVYLNRAAEKLYGWTRAEALGKQILELTVPQISQTEALEIIAQLTEGKSWSGEFLVQRRDGTTFPAAVHNTPILDATGKLTGIIGISFDITERKQAEEALRTSEARAKAMLQAIPDFVFHLDRHGVFLNYKADPKDLYAQSEPTLIGKRNRDLSPPEFADLIDHQIHTALETQAMQTFEYQLPIAGSGMHDYEARMVPSGADEVITIVRDFTERKRAEAERHAREQQMVEDQRLQSLGLLAGGVAHDINNLLTPIWTNIELLRLTRDNSPQTIEQLNAVVTATQRARDLVRQMLAYAGRHPMVLAQVELNGLITESQSLLRSSLPKNISIQWELASEPLPIVADYTQLQQVVMNLILNAAEAFEGKAGEVFVTTRRQPTATTSSGAEVALAVRDTGPGIAPEHLSRIFDPFFTTKTAGHGLGLSATQGIIRAHHGSLEVQSVVDKGTTFTIRLPLGEPVATPAVSPAPAIQAAQSVHGLWLVIDDEAIVRTSTCRVLRHMKLRTLAASDGASGLALARQHAAELTGVLLDLTMPGMSGREVLHQLRAEYPTVPVILLSGFTEHEVHDLLALHKVVFIAKPYDLQTLERLVRDLSQ